MATREFSKFNPYNSYAYGNHKVVVLRRERVRLRKHLSFLLVFFFSVALLAAFLRSPLFTIKELDIYGINELTYTEVKKVSNVQIGSNIWSNSLAEIRDNIASLARVDEVEVKRHFPNRLEIIINEAETAALIPYQGSFLHLSAEGMLLGISSTFRDGVPVVTGVTPGSLQSGEKVGNEEQRELLYAFITALRDHPQLMISEINIAEPSCAVAFTTDGLEVRLGDVENMPAKLETLLRILPHVLAYEGEGYLDLRAGNPVFKPY